MNNDLEFIAYLLKELFALKAKAINVRVTNHVHCEVIANIHQKNPQASNLMMIDRFVGREAGDKAYFAIKALVEQFTMTSDGRRPGVFNLKDSLIGLHLNPSILPMPCQVMVGYAPESSGSFLYVLSVLKLQKVLSDNQSQYDSFVKSISEQHILSQLTDFV